MICSRRFGLVNKIKTLKLIFLLKYGKKDGEDCLYEVISPTIHAASALTVLSGQLQPALSPNPR